MLSHVCSSFTGAACSTHSNSCSDSSRTGFTLIELLVVVAIIVVLMGVLLPAIQRVRGAAQRMLCASHLRQNTLAVHHYQLDVGKLPTANTLGWPKQRNWFGEVDYETNQVDARLGLISSYIEGNQEVLRCPTFDPQQVEPLYGGLTGGYGYNLNLGAVDYSNWPSPPMLRSRAITDFPATSRTIVFTDSARIQLPWSGDPVLRATESYYLTGPDDPFAEPGTHFRHAGIANVAFLDGHVEGLREAPLPAPSYWPDDAVHLKGVLKIGYVHLQSVEAYRPR